MPIRFFLSQTYFNISQLHNNNRLQINMKFTKKPFDIDCSSSKRTTTKKSFKNVLRHFPSSFTPRFPFFWLATDD